MLATQTTTENENVGAGSGLATAAAAAGLLATVVTGLACVGPLVAIVLGIGGMGFLVNYAYLRVPATIVTLAMLAFGFYWTYRRPRRACCSDKARGRRRLSRVLLWIAAVMALAINVFEYLIFPYVA